MVKGSEKDLEILQQAATAAAALLPQLEKRIASLKAVIAAAEAASNGAAGSSPSVAVPRGQVGEHIDAILKAGGAHREQEIGKLIAQRFHVVYGRPTIYSALRRGLKAGKYERKERGKWRLKTS